MEAFHNPHLKEIVVCCGTKYGKTLSAAGAMVLKAPLHKQALYRWVGPIFQQAKIGMRYCHRLLPGAPYTLSKFSDMVIDFPSIESQIQFYHGQKPESLEGEASRGNVIDEAAKQKYEVYSSVLTTTTQTGAPIMMVSTPLGKGWFYDKYIEAKLEMERAAYENRPARMLAIHAPTADNPFVPRESIEFAKQRLPDRLFRQYYLAEFIDDGTIFLGTRECICTDIIAFPPGERHYWRAENCHSADVVIGVDWAKKKDHTVFFAADLATNRIVGFERFQQMPYTEQVRRLVYFARSFRSITVVLHDKTGVGEAIDDMLSHTGLPYQGVTFTNASKSEMVTNLMTSFETGMIGIPNYYILVSELDAYEVQTNAIGLMSYSAPSGKHDDTVSALMLLNAALMQYGNRECTVRLVEDLPKIKIAPTPLEVFLQDMRGDD